jgi:acid phosphatase class B
MYKHSQTERIAKAFSCRLGGVAMLSQDIGGAVAVLGPLGGFKSNRVAIFDLDGVIFDSSERFRKALEETSVSEEEFRSDYKKRAKVWEVFLSNKYIELDRVNPEVFGYILKAKMTGLDIVLLTGRPAKMLEKTVEMLRKNNIEYNMLIMRADNDRSKDHEFKARVIKKLAETGIEVYEIHDDSEDVIKAVLRIVPGVRAVRWIQGGGKPYPRTVFS